MNIAVSPELRTGLITMLLNAMSDDSDYTSFLRIFLAPRIDFVRYTDLHSPINSIMGTLANSLISGTLTETDVLRHLGDIISLHADFKELTVVKEVVQLLIGISCLNSTTNISTNYNHAAIRSCYMEILEEMLLC